MSEPTPFHPFGRQHLVVLGLTAALAAGLPWLARQGLNPTQQLWLGRGLAVVMTAAVIGWTLLRLRLGQFDKKSDLPLDICNFLGLTLLGLLWEPRPLIFQIAFYIVIAGTVQALLTPHLEEGFPHFTFVKYWLVHGGLVVMIVYAAAVFDLRPTWPGLWLAFGVLQLYALLLYWANVALDANYLYLRRKPPQATLLDVLGPWPWYILAVEGIGLLLFLALYALFGAQA